MDLNRRTALKAFGTALAAGAVGGRATATDGASSGRPRSEAVAMSYLSNDDLLDNAELERILMRLAEKRPDRVSVREIGRSNQGRPIRAACVSRCDDATDVMAVGQQHGDETVSSAEGLLAALAYLASGRANAERMLRDVTFHVVPRINPDGFVARQRYNVDTSAPASGEGDGIFGGDAGFYTADQAGIGWDINRYHWPDWTESNLYQNLPEEYPENPVTEAQAMLDAVEEVDPAWIADFHRQGTYTVDEDAEFDPENPSAAYERAEENYPPDPDADGGGDVVTSSLFWPINENVPTEAQNLSKRLVVTMFDRLTEFDQSTVTRYPGGTYAGIARNAYGLTGRGSVLFELSAGTLGDRSYRIRQVFEAVLSAVDATATGALDGVDPDRTDELPERHVDGFTVEAGE